MEFNFLVIRQDRIGDVVLSLPIVMNLRRDFPGCKITVLLRNYARGVYEHSPYIDRIISYDNYDLNLTGIIKLAAELRKHNFTHSIMPLPGSPLNLAVFLAGIRVRISNGHKPYQFLTNTKSTYRRKYIQNRHESDYCLDPVRKLALETSIRYGEIHLSEDEKEKVRQLRNKLCPNGEKLISLNSSSGNSAPNMPVSEYVNLASLLSKKGNYKVLVTDRDVNPEFGKFENVHFLEDKDDLRELILGIAASDIMVSSSTGPMHLAGALGIRTASVFCPLPACSPALWGAPGDKAEYIMPDEGYCGSVCSGKPASCRFEGKGGIDAGKVFEVITNKA